ncbi:hypothetical protein D3C76_1411990 [compost metagenome]
MAETIDGETAEIAIEQAQVSKDPLGKLAGVGPKITGDDRPVLLGAILHVGEAGLLIHRRSGCRGCATHSTVTVCRGSGR